jgi:hypothetical protein
MSTVQSPKSKLLNRRLPQWSFWRDDALGTFFIRWPGPDDHYGRSHFMGVSGEAIYRLLSPTRK